MNDDDDMDLQAGGWGMSLDEIWKKYGPHMRAAMRLAEAEYQLDLWFENTVSDCEACKEAGWVCATHSVTCDLLNAEERAAMAQYREYKDRLRQSVT